MEPYIMTDSHKDRADTWKTEPHSSRCIMWKQKSCTLCSAWKQTHQSKNTILQTTQEDQITDLIISTIIIISDKKEPMSEVSKQKSWIIEDVWVCGGYLAVHGSSKTVSSRRLKKLPRPSLIKSDDGSHVVFAYRAVDERGDEDSSQPLHTVQVCKGLIGKVPETERGYTIISRVRGNTLLNVPYNIK